MNAKRDDPSNTKTNPPSMCPTEKKPADDASPFLLPSHLFQCQSYRHTDPTDPWFLACVTRALPRKRKKSKPSISHLISSTLCASTTAKRPLLATGICQHSRVRARVSTRLCLCVQQEKKASVCSSMPLLTDLVCRKSRSCVLPLLGRRVVRTKQSVLCFACLPTSLSCLVCLPCFTVTIPAFPACPASIATCDCDCDCYSSCYQNAAESHCRRR